MKRPIRELKRRFCSRYYIDTNGEVKNSILLAGTGRSGTTWLAEVLNYRNQFRVLFEPFHRRAFRALGITSYFDIYHPVDAVDQVGEEHAGRVLRGQSKQALTDSHNRKLFCTRRLIKDVSCNVSLPWLQQKFPELPVIFLLRHPLAVAQSKMALDWDEYLDLYMGQEELCSQRLKPFLALCQTAKSPFERHVAQWCIENYIPLSDLRSEHTMTLFYEDLILDPKPQLDRLFKFLGIEYNQKLFSMLEKPSLTASKQFRAGRALQSFDSLKKKVGEESVKRAMEIVSGFGFDALYGEEPEPRTSEIVKDFRCV